MVTKRRGVRCVKCRKKYTKSVTRFCRECRPEFLLPPVHTLDKGMVSVEGITLTTDQARRLADALHEAADKAVIA